jgi:hypothetical protein
MRLRWPSGRQKLSGRLFKPWSSRRRPRRLVCGQSADVTNCRPALARGVMLGGQVLIGTLAIRSRPLGSIPSMTVWNSAHKLSGREQDCFGNAFAVFRVGH